MSKRTAPEAIINAATAMLAPYFPELSANGLVEALKDCDKPKDIATPSKPLTRRQACEILQISLASVNRRIKDGTLRAFKISPRLVRIDPTSVEALMRAERETTAAVTEA